MTRRLRWTGDNGPAFGGSFARRSSGTPPFGRRLRSPGALLVALSLAAAILDFVFCFGFMTRQCGGLFFAILFSAGVVALVGYHCFVTSFVGSSHRARDAVSWPHVMYVFGPSLLFLMGSEFVPWRLFSTHDTAEAVTALVFVWPLIGYAVFAFVSRR